MPNHAAAKAKKAGVGVAATAAVTSAVLAASSSGTVPLTAASSAAASPSSNSSNTIAVVVDKSEVQSLKKRIEEMSKNMDKLTELVQKVSLHQQGDVVGGGGAGTFGNQNKRKKISSPDAASEENNPLPEGVPSLSNDGGFMDLDELAAATTVPLPEASLSSSGGLFAMPSCPSPVLTTRETSSESDSTFVDQLFSAFSNNLEDSDSDMEFLDSVLSSASPSTSEPLYVALGGTTATATMYSSAGSNYGGSSSRPDPELMRRLGDALELLPRSIQELIIDRLIAAITSTDGLQHLISPMSNSSSANAALGKDVVAGASKITARTDAAEMDVRDDATQSSASSSSSSNNSSNNNNATPMLTTETLAALLHHYTNQVKVAETASSAKKLQKSLPVIEAHA
jgi:hypothetical protein